jgi:hypothetical protein
MPLSERDRRSLIIGGVIMAVMIGGFLIFNVASSGTSAGPSFAPLHPSGSGAPTSGPTVAPSGVPTGGPTGVPTVPPIQNFSGRDPFSIPPVLQSASASSSGGGGSSGSPSGSPSGTGSPTATPTSPGGGSSSVVGGHSVVLLDVFTRNGAVRAQVEVDGVVYNVGIGDTFASGQFKLRSVSANCATLLYGDQSITLCSTSPK